MNGDKSKAELAQKKTASRTKTNQETAQADNSHGLKIPIRFSDPDIHPYDRLTWEKRDALIQNEKGETVFEQKDVEFPSDWSMSATQVVTSKYFRKDSSKGPAETSVRQLVDRVAKTITVWGTQGGYFLTNNDGRDFDRELTSLLVGQYAAFNSPVWFNVGIEDQPQCSACFINSVEDSMRDILGLVTTEGMLFKHGSGSGTNLSNIRSSKEKLSGGGEASGPVSFMKGFDSFAGVIKSGGKTRRAAKMVILNIDHPDILEFIESKAREEKKAWALIDEGYDGGFNVKGGAYDSVQFQNANHSVRVTDEFMNAVEADENWQTLAVTSKEPMETLNARDLMKSIAQAAWLCGDPGIQFHTTINDWHTCKNVGPINASNPCSEYMFLDDSACNLASLNLLKFLNDDATFDVQGFRHAVRMIILSQEIIVGNAGYPTEKIGKNSLEYRPLGLGYANLGALLMSLGIPYDSDLGRTWATCITSLMSGEAYRASAEIASHLGPFEGYRKNWEPMQKVMEKHRDAAAAFKTEGLPEDLAKASKAVWDEVLELGAEHGYRNSQISVLAPTGTIGFMMDCDTTGIEPELALVKYKKLVGGGTMKVVNQSVARALHHLGYADKDIEKIKDHIDEAGTIEGAPGLKKEDLPVFDCALKPASGERLISSMGHVRMMGAVQPFISGAISKTVNLPHEATVDEIMDIYMSSWKLGLKAVAVYRDGCKRTQPLTTSEKENEVIRAFGATDKAWPVRRRLPNERQALTHKFSIGGHEGYITVGMYEDGTPGEIFIVMAKEGSVVSGLVDTVATATSIALQYGVPLDVLVNKFSHTRFEPSGFTGNPKIPIAKSLIDYIFRWLGSKFCPETDSEDQKLDLGSTEVLNKLENASSQTDPVQGVPAPLAQMQSDSPPCSDCGSIMVRSGSCYKCVNCGSTSGCS